MSERVKRDTITNILVCDLKNEELFFKIPTSGSSKGTPLYMDGERIDGPGYVGDGSVIKTLKFKVSSINHFIWWVGTHCEPEDLEYLKVFLSECVKKFTPAFFSDIYLYDTENKFNPLMDFIGKVIPKYVSAFTDEKLLILVTKYVKDRLVLQEDDHSFTNKLTSKDIFVITCTSVLIKLVEIMLSPFKEFIVSSDPRQGNICPNKKDIKLRILDMMMSICIDLSQSFDEYCDANVHYLESYSRESYNTMDNLYEHIEYKISTTDQLKAERFTDDLHVPNGTAFSDVKNECLNEAITNTIKMRPTVCYDADRTIDEKMVPGVEKLEEIIAEGKKNTKISIDNIHAGVDRFEGMSEYEYGREFGFNGTKVSSFLVKRIAQKSKGTVSQKVYEEVVKNIPNYISGEVMDGDVSASDILEQEYVVNNPAKYKREVAEKDWIMSEMEKNIPEEIDINLIINSIRYNKNNNPLAKFLLGDAMVRRYGVDITKYMTNAEIKYAMAYMYITDKILYDYGLRTSLLAETYHSEIKPMDFITTKMLKPHCRNMRDNLNDMVLRLCKSKYIIHNLDGTKTSEQSFALPLRDYLVDKVNGDIDNRITGGKRNGL